MILERDRRQARSGGHLPWSGSTVKLSKTYTLLLCGLFAAALLAPGRTNAQNLTLEGQTGGFITPTAYVVESSKGHVFSHPAVGFHFIGAAKVIGNIETFSITEGFANRAEVGYTRSVHQDGDTPIATSTNEATSSLWDFDGMNVFHGKVVGLKDGQFGPWTPGVAVGGVVRTDDKFVTGAAGPLGVELYDQYCIQTMLCAPVAVPAAKAYTNGDVYVSVTKTWAKKPVPFLANVGWKATNAAIYGIGGQATRFGGRLFGGIGIPLPLFAGIVAVPSAGFTQEPPTAKGLGPAPPNGIPFVAGKADLPTTLDYAVRFTQREHAHFSFDIGVGQVAGNIGSIPTGLPSPYPASIPVNLEARHVVGLGLSIRP
jgi:hypothetical protein